MRSMRYFLAILLWLLMVTTASASVRVNEIAWMGTSISGTNEWIELLNESDVAVDLSGWSIVASDGSPSIILSGSIAPRGYFLIERTDDTTVPDIVADQVTPFGSGLSNAGETLSLNDATEVIIDTVVGGTDWENIGGDNTTKETAQYTSSGWVTGTPTPRTANVSHGKVLGASTIAPPPPETTSSPSVETSSGVALNISTTPTYPRKEISVFAGDDKQVLAALPVSFWGTAYGLYDEALPYATYRWNLGDGTSKEGKDVTHSYDFPGEYIVTLDVFWGGKSKTDRASVIVVSPSVTIGSTSSGKEGFIELVNHSTKEVELSLWQLHLSSGATFIIPNHTFIGAGQSIRFSNKTTNLLDTSSGVTLSYPNDGVVVSSTTIPPEERASVLPAKKTDNSFAASSRTAILASVKNTVKEDVPIMATGETAPSSVLWQGSIDDGISIGNISKLASSNMTWVFLSFFALLVIFAGFIISRNGRENSIASEYAIIEDMIEGKDDLAKD